KKTAGDRTHDVFRALGLSILPAFKLPLTKYLISRSSQLLKEHGWSETSKLIVLNPAGLTVTRNWPLENYSRLARLWLQQEQLQFLVLGTSRIKEKADFLKRELRDSLINLAEKTSLAEAFAVVQHSSAVVSEDSGLMHMAWVSGIPTLALFGSSPHYWARPLGQHSLSLDSGDLECGACRQATCKYGDVHCLTRYTPERLLDVIQRLMMDREKEVMTA
ncbi:MAG: glycosyltransferase family 9 protein, partial [Bacteroidota bacterium]